MAEFVTGFTTPEGIKKYDYNSLGNKPDSFSNALKGSAIGAVVRVDDVSPIVHSVGCKVKSKNLFNNASEYYPAAGASYTNDDNTLTVTGYYASKFIQLDDEKTYTLSFQSTRTGNYGGGAYIACWNSSVSQVLYTAASNRSATVMFTVPKGFGRVQFTFYGSNSTEAASATYTNIMLEEGSEATGYVPYVDPSIATVTQCGKNLIPLTAAASGTTQGLNYTNNGNGVVTIDGTATSAAYVPVETNLYLPAGKYVLSQQGDEISPSYLYITGATGYNPVTNNGSKVVTSAGGICQLYVYVAADTVVGNKTVKVMLEAGEIKTNFEQPVESKITTANSDGAVDGMNSFSPTMTFMTDTENTVVNIEYQRDIDKAIKEIEQILSPARIVYINILASAWKGSNSLYSQVVTVPGATKNSQVDLTPSIDQLVIFYNKNLTFVTENVNGVVTVYAIGQKPQSDYTIQATVTEVNR